MKFIPLLKRIRWGGRRLGDLLGKTIGIESDYAESWEVCDHGADQSLVAAGEFAGWSLQRLVQERSTELLGQHAAERHGVERYAAEQHVSDRNGGKPQFPLLIKFLDAHDRLSVQVHPNDEQADRFLSGERGKTEAWVILAADPGSCVFSGLKPGVTIESLRRALQDGTVESCLHRLAVTPGDCVFIPAGTVHAIGEGILVAEVQQSSDLTFRLFDWNRVGADGKPRDLHVEQSLACVDFSRGPVNPTVPTAISQISGESERLVDCKYFTIRRHTVERPLSFPDDNRCRIIVMLDGAGECANSGGRQPICTGETVLIPAAGRTAILEPQPHAVVLEVFW